MHKLAKRDKQSLPLSVCHFAPYPISWFITRGNCGIVQFGVKMITTCMFVANFVKKKFFAFLCFHFQHHYELPNLTNQVTNAIQLTTYCIFPQFLPFSFSSDKPKAFFCLSFLICQHSPKNTLFFLRLII